MEPIVYTLITCTKILKNHPVLRQDTAFNPIFTGTGPRYVRGLPGYVGHKQTFLDDPANDVKKTYYERGVDRLRVNR
jgi:hypothetical protein